MVRKEPLKAVNLGISTAKADDDIPGSFEDSDKTHREIIYDKFDTYHGGEEAEAFEKIQNIMHRKITADYSDMTPHVNGYYYIQMVHGTWADHLSGMVSSKDTTKDKVSFDDVYRADNDLSTFNSEHFERVSQNFGQLATDIDIPQLNIEYESLSGKSRNLSYASRIHYAGDFSINFLENYTNDIFRYHESWFKYIDALKKGYINLSVGSKNTDTETFIDVPYFNAVWIVIFAPMSTNIRGLVKIMGASPINLPFKQIIGDRSKSTLTTINQSYKSNDMIYKFFDEESEYIDSPFFQEFQADMGRIHKVKV